jgi:hypothetical protein
LRSIPLQRALQSQSKKRQLVGVTFNFVVKSFKSFQNDFIYIEILV